MGRNVVIVGGGLAGMAAAVYLARAGRSVTLFERRRLLGGRAITTVRQGYRFNLGAHGLYRHGAAASVYRELGIPIRGGTLRSGAHALHRGDTHRLPTGLVSLLTTSLLSFRGKRELASALLRVRRRRPAAVAEGSVREWLDAHFDDARARQVMETFLRIFTYTSDDRQSAAAALAQARIALRGGVLYLDEGWQRLVDALHSTAVAAGVHFVSSSRIVGVVQDGAVRAVELGGLELDADRSDTLAMTMPSGGPEEIEGALIPAETVLLAVDPHTAADLAGEVGQSWRAAQPVTAACLDVALRSLPRPHHTFVAGIDEPLYLSVHSAAAQLTPKGGALVHLVKYGARDPERDERDLETMLDRYQPGWREVLVHRRYLPAMTVSNALIAPGARRPSVTTPVRGLYLAGDWVGDEGMLSDAALSSARAAAQAILRE
ncbi:MAG TPA: FAD-dependent oxidoreductase [Thermoanaerobaculia bacterium]